MLNYLKGDLFEFVKNVDSGTVLIPHVCNNIGAWGSGFVVPLGKNYPASAEAYHHWHNFPEKSLKPFALGWTQFVPVSENVVVANMVAQEMGGNRPLYYQHLASCMSQVADFCAKFPNHRCPLRIYAPMFGSKLAGGNWDFIEELIKDCWIRNLGLDVNVCYLPGQTPEGWTPPNA